MTGIQAILTPTTCGEACWKAEELVCRCSCGGKNHGCLKTEDGIRPTRTAKIDGIRYELKAVNSQEVYDEAERINKESGPRESIAYTQGGKPTDYPWAYTDPGAPARVKHATTSQLAGWPELAAWREMTKQELYFNPVILLWVKI